MMTHIPQELPLPGSAPARRFREPVKDKPRAAGIQLAALPTLALVASIALGTGPLGLRGAVMGIDNPHGSSSKQVEQTASEQEDAARIVTVVPDLGPALLGNSIPLDLETQRAIWDSCDHDSRLFCMVMAIAAHETGYDPNTIGDGGNSIGMMQINTPWHMERIDALGVTDLTDPVQCAKVAIDYLRELKSQYGSEFGTHEIAIYYNMGVSGGRKAFREGYTTTKYSRAVIGLYEQYVSELAELEAQG